MAFGEGGGGGDATAPLISSDHRKHNIVRSGNEWTASAHVITAVIGSGVLSLAWSMAQLGWVAGPGMMVVFASVTALQSTIFADCYRSPDPEHGPHRNRTYAHAVERNLGSSSAWVCMLLQQTALFGYGIAYTITASTSFRFGFWSSSLDNVHCRKTEPNLLPFLGFVMILLTLSKLENVTEKFARVRFLKLHEGTVKSIKQLGESYLRTYLAIC